MSRPRAFDEDGVRERVTDVFTASGYRGTSISMLAEAAGLGKQSMYNAFGDKQNLYLLALDQAAARMGSAQESMARAHTGYAAIEVFFDALLGLCHHPDPSVHTCIVSAGLLEGIEDEQISGQLREKWRSTSQLLGNAIERGQSDGSIRTDVDAATLSKLLMTLMSGLRVTARAVQDLRHLQTITALGLQVLAQSKGGD